MGRGRVGGMSRLVGDCTRRLGGGSDASARAHDVERPEREDGVVPRAAGASGRPGRALRGMLGGRHPAAVFFAALLVRLRGARGRVDRRSGYSSTDVLLDTSAASRAADNGAIAPLVAERTGVPHRRLDRSARPSAARRCCRSSSGSIAIVCAFIARAGGSPRSRSSCSSVESATYRVTIARRPARPPARAPARGPAGRTRATRPATPPRRSPSTRASCCCSRRGVPQPRAADRRLGVRDRCCRVFVAIVAHVPRHAPPARRRRRRRSSASARSLVLLFACRAAGAAERSPARGAAPPRGAPAAGPRA